MISTSALKPKTNIKNAFKVSKYNKEFMKNNPDYFHPSGFTCFVGTQGSGKTLSAVIYVYTLMKYYTKCILVTNIDLKDYPVDNVRVFKFEKAEDLLKYKNGKLGVIFLIDEIHLYMGSQKGRENLNPEVLQAICQQRKQRIHIVSTTQFFAQLNINLRRHFDNIILCETCWLGFGQKLSLIDRNSIEEKESSKQTLEGTVVWKCRYWRSPKMFELYDTYAIINNNLAVGLERKEGNYYDNTNIKLSNYSQLSGSIANNINSNSSDNNTSGGVR